MKWPVGESSSVSVCVFQCTCAQLSGYLQGMHKYAHLQHESCCYFPWIHINKDLDLNEMNHFQFFPTPDVPFMSTHNSAGVSSEKESTRGHRRRWVILPMMAHQSLSVVKHPIRGTLPVSRPIRLMGEFFIFLFNQTEDVKYLSYQNISSVQG